MLQVFPKINMVGLVVFELGAGESAFNGTCQREVGVLLLPFLYATVCGDLYGRLCRILA